MEVSRFTHRTLHHTINEHYARRERAEHVYRPPQIADDEDIGKLLLQHMQDHRRLFIEHPRVRLDGVYIAVCHYMCVDSSFYGCILSHADDASMQPRWSQRECLGSRMNLPS